MNLFNKTKTKIKKYVEPTKSSSTKLKIMTFRWQYCCCIFNETFQIIQNFILSFVFILIMYFYERDSRKCGTRLIWLRRKSFSCKLKGFFFHFFRQTFWGFSVLLASQKLWKIFNNLLFFKSNKYGSSFVVKFRS